MGTPVRGPDRMAARRYRLGRPPGRGRGHLHRAGRGDHPLRARVIVCVADDDLQAYARARLRSARVDMSRVRFVEVAYDDTWLRDSGPITLRDGDGFRLLDFRFTGWGGKFDASRDDQLVEAPARSGTLRQQRTRKPIDFALEGGAIETDGAGTLLTTWQLPARAPSRRRSREQLDRASSRELAAAGPRAVARPRLPRRRRHRRPHRHPRALRRARRDRLPGLRRPDRLALRRTAGDGATKSLRCARATASRTGCSRCRGRSRSSTTDRRLRGVATRIS